MTFNGDLRYDNTETFMECGTFLTSTSMFLVWGMQAPQLSKQNCNISDDIILLSAVSDSCCIILFRNGCRDLKSTWVPSLWMIHCILDTLVAFFSKWMDEKETMKLLSQDSAGANFLPIHQFLLQTLRSYMWFIRLYAINKIISLWQIGNSLSRNYFGHCTSQQHFVKCIKSNEYSWFKSVQAAIIQMELFICYSAK